MSNMPRFGWTTSTGHTSTANSPSRNARASFPPSSSFNGPVRRIRCKSIGSPIGPRKGWLALNIEPHDVLPDQPQAYYDALPDALKHYESIGNNDRDKSYFLRMYLADYRAVDYIASRPIGTARRSS